MIMGGGFGGYICTAATCSPSVIGQFTDLLLSIQSGGPIPLSLSYNVLNGVNGAGTLDIQYFDTAFVDPGTPQTRSFSGAAGTWSVTGQSLPIASTLLLMLLPGLGLMAMRKTGQGQA